MNIFTRTQTPRWYHVQHDDDDDDFHHDNDGDDVQHDDNGDDAGDDIFISGQRAVSLGALRDFTKNPTQPPTSLPSSSLSLR